jgi:hypothetical protein
MKRSWASIAIVGGLLAIAAFTYGASDERRVTRMGAPVAHPAIDAPDEKPATPPAPPDVVAPDPAIAGHQ